MREMKEKSEENRKEHPEIIGVIEIGENDQREESIDNQAKSEGAQ